MKAIVHNNKLYLESCIAKERAEVASRRLEKTAELNSRTSRPTEIFHAGRGRNLFARAIDGTLNVLRNYFPVSYRIIIAILAFCFFIYAQITAHTVRFVNDKRETWRQLDAPCVLTIWHGCAPTLLVALTALKPKLPVAIMITKDPRGDLLALLCKMLRLRVVRGGNRAGGWEALVQLADKIKGGAFVIITPDGGGPERIAKLGAAALASAAGVPLVALGADCRPAIFQTHKWDSARTPVPFGCIAVKIGETLNFPVFDDPASLDSACSRLQCALNDAAEAAEKALERKGRQH